MKDRKRNKNSCWLIIIIFLGLIYLPTLTFPIFQDKIAIDDSENRSLTEVPELSVDKLTEFPKQFDAYYNDHLPYRTVLRSIWTRLNLLLLHDSVNQKVVIGKSDNGFSSSWLFYNNDMDFNAIKEVQGLTSYSRTQSDDMIATMRWNTKLAKDKGIQLYYFLAPDKENIYRNKLPDNIQIYDDDSSTDKFVKYAWEQGVQNLIYPRAELLAATNNCQVYYKQDTHWNSCGGFIGFREIVKKVNPEYVLPENVDFVKNSRVDQDLARMMSAGDYFQDEDEVADYLSDSKYESTRVTGGAEGIEVYTNANAPIKKTILISGDSYRNAMKQYFGKTYEKSVFLHRRSYRKDLVSMYNPDIIIFEFVERASSAIRTTNL